MGKIHWGRVILGGLVTGLIINIGEFLVHGLMLNSDWKVWGETFARYMPPNQQTTSMLWYNLDGFLVGLVALWLYAAIRPRYGAGPGTAVRAGLGLWLLWAISNALLNAGFGLVPAKLLWTPAAADLVIALIATLAGAALYREA